MASPQDELLPYYQRELGYLREQGAAFARRHPKLAQRLELGLGETADPHVERLLEAFAFLTARLQYNIDNEFPEIPTALLELLYPQLAGPIPAMAIARFVVDPARGDLTEGFTVPRHTPLFAETSAENRADRLLCRFRTAYPTILWPLQVEQAQFDTPGRYPFLDRRPEIVSVLRLRLSTTADSLGDLRLRQLRFFLEGSRSIVYRLYELLCCHTRGLGVCGVDGGDARLLPAGAIRPVGFAADEDLLPYPPTAHPAYRLLQECLTFPDKFLFIDVDGLELPPDGREFDLLVLLDRTFGEPLQIDKYTFRLGCTPIINLFSKTTEPIRLDHRKPEYRLVPDLHRERITEIHSIQKVSAVSDASSDTQLIAPFFCYNHELAERGQNAFWHARRQATGRVDLPGTEMIISFLDLDFNPALPPHQTVYAHTLCSNRDLAAQLPAGAVLQAEAAAPVVTIFALTKPTEPLDPPLHGQALWRLISHLSLNYLSLSEGKDSLEALARDSAPLSR